MHIPDGFLSGEAAALGGVVAATGLAVCVRRAGAEGHLLGGTLAVALLGPWLGAITIAVVCAVQALALGDGGITTLGLNVVDLALVPAFVGYPLLLALRRLLPTTVSGLATACGLAAAVDVLLAAGLFVAMFALGAVVPIDLRALAASTLGAYAVIAVIEGVITALIVRALLGVRPDLVRVAEPLRRRRQAPALGPRGEVARPPSAVASRAGRPEGGTPWA